jgi:hypothetical protein
LGIPVIIFKILKSALMMKVLVLLAKVETKMLVQLQLVTQMLIESIASIQIQEAKDLEVQNSTA